MNYKKDKRLGNLIHKVLIDYELETPTGVNVHLRKDLKLVKIEHAFEEIMLLIGLDTNNDSLKDTPKRIAKMYVEEIFYGLDYANFPKCTTVENTMKYDEMITVKDIKSMSVCEHHFVTIDGVCKISYIPKHDILGLSKFNRIVDFFSRRPQIQERLTEQIYYALEYILGTPDIAVKIDSKHYCVVSRGVNDLNSITTTTKLGGKFKGQTERNEFLNS